MDKVLLYIFEFVVAFVLVFLYQKLFVEDKYRKDIDKKRITIDNKNRKTPQELLLFLKMTGLKEKDIDVFKTLRVLTVVNAFDIALVLLITEVTSILLLKVLIALVAIFVVLIVSYKILAKVFKKKGKINK